MVVLRTGYWKVLWEAKNGSSMTVLRELSFGIFIFKIVGWAHGSASDSSVFPSVWRATPAQRITLALSDN